MTKKSYQDILDNFPKKPMADPSKALIELASNEAESSRELTSDLIQFIAQDPNIDNFILEELEKIHQASEQAFKYISRIDI